MRVSSIFISISACLLFFTSCSNKEEVKSEIDHIMISMFQVVNPNLDSNREPTEELIEEPKNSKPSEGAKENESELDSLSEKEENLETNSQKEQQQNWNSAKKRNKGSNQKYDSYKATDLDNDLLKAAEQLEKALNEQSESKKK